MLSGRQLLPSLQVLAQDSSSPCRLPSTQLLSSLHPSFLALLPVFTPGSAKCFCKSPESKYFSICGSYILYDDYSPLSLWSNSSHRQYENA